MDLVGQYVYYFENKIEILCKVAGVTMPGPPYKPRATAETIVSNIGIFDWFDTGGELDMSGVVVSEEFAEFILMFADPRTLRQNHI